MVPQGNLYETQRKPPRNQGRKAVHEKKLLTCKNLTLTVAKGHKVNLEKSTNFSKGRVGAVTKAIENLYDTFKSKDYIL